MGNSVLLLPFFLTPKSRRRERLSFKHSPHFKRRGIFGSEDHVIYLALANMSTSTTDWFISHVGLIREFGEPFSLHSPHIRHVTNLSLAALILTDHLWRIIYGFAGRC